MKASVSLGDIQDMLGKAKSDPKALANVEQILMQMLEHEPDNWPILFYLGTLYLHTDKPQLAVLAMNRAAQLKDDVQEIWNNLGTSYRKLHMPDRAEKALMKALGIKEDADVYNNLATLHINEGSPHLGEEWARKSIALDPHHNQAFWNLALCQLEQEKWAEGFRNYIYGLKSGDRITKHYNNASWWDGDAHPDACLVVFGEQGIGDEIMFSSCLPDLRKAFQGEVVLDCHPRLEGLFKRSFPDMPVYPTRKDLDRRDYQYWVDKHKPLYKLAIGDLPRWFRDKPHKFPRKPYLIADPVRVAEYKHWLELLGEPPYIGVSWFGGHKTTRKDLRSLDVEELEPFLDMGTVISCQYSSHNRDAEARGIQTLPEVFEAGRWEHYYIKDDKGEVMAEARKKEHAREFQQTYGGKLEHVPGAAYDYDEAAAFVQAIDDMGGAVVTVNTSLVHLCGALGVKCFVLTPSKPAWRYGMKRRNMIWYGDWVRQYRQVGEDWAPAIAELKSELETYLKLKRKAVA